MLLKQINLNNFRNYQKLNLNFDERPALLLGNNAAGKSNLLEAIYLLSTGKSQRVGEEVELIKQGEEVGRVDGLLGGETSLEIGMQVVDGVFSKRVKVNGISRRVVDFIGNLPAVIFYPSDINMVTGAPALRRWHLDLSLAQMDPNYKRSLTLYEQVLTNRNKVLKRIREGLGKADELSYWTSELIKYGDSLSHVRAAFLEFLSNLETPLGKFRFPYMKSELSDEKLNQYHVREIAAAATLVGPHRDNFEVQIRNSNLEIRNLSRFGSRGEQRTATLAFKLGALEYMALSLGKRPILLLDDVFSELDVEHRAHVVEVVGKQQTIIATVELENIPKEFLDQARILKVEDGKISNLSS